MPFLIKAALRVCLREEGQSMASHVLVLAPLIAVIALAVCTVIIAGSN